MSILASNLLQERVNELDSTIFSIIEDKVHLIGFFNEQRLMTHLNDDMDNWRSIGLYDYQDVSFQNIKDNALFLIVQDGEVIEKHKYTVYLRDEVERKDKSGRLILMIRKHEFTEEWQVIVLRKTHNFTSKKEMENFLTEHYRFDFEL